VVVSQTEPHVPPPLVYVGVVDDNTFYRDWLGQAGTLPAHHHVIARAADAQQLAAVLTELPDGRCDVVLLDLRIAPERGADPVYGGGIGTAPAVQGRAAVELLLRVAQSAVAAGHLARVPAILVYTQELAPRVHVACLLAGAAGVVHKAEPLERLGQAIDIVAAGGVVVDERMATLIELLANQHRLDLTETESAVLALAGHGLTRRQIAGRLDCAESTVDKHLRAIRDKFGADVHFTDLADAYGLRDLAPPETISAPVRRDRLRTLARRLSQGR
jgi:DNA-binding NarL/FixJ family response regulator